MSNEANIDPAIIAAGIAVADSLAKQALGSGKYDIAASLLNGTPYELTSIPYIKVHHGQYTMAPTVAVEPVPDSVAEEEKFHYNIGLASMKSTGASCSEALFGYELVKNGTKYQTCYYIKHGHSLESGSCVWEKGKKVNGKDYQAMLKGDAIDLIKHIQKVGTNKLWQTTFSKKGATVENSSCGFKIKHGCAHTVTFEFTEE